MLPNANNSIQHLLNNYFDTEQLDYTCNNCMCTGANKYLTVTAEPLILIITVKLFDEHLSKQSCKVISEDSLSLNTMNGKCFYVLAGTVTHYGNTLSAGHYVSFIKEGDQWFKMNDLQIKTASLSEAMNDPYLLIYVKPTNDDLVICHQDEPNVQADPENSISNDSHSFPSNYLSEISQPFSEISQPLLNKYVSLQMDYNNLPLYYCILCDKTSPMKTVIFSHVHEHFESTIAFNNTPKSYAIEKHEYQSLEFQNQQHLPLSDTVNTPVHMSSNAKTPALQATAHATTFKITRKQMNTRSTTLKKPCNKPTHDLPNANGEFKSTKQKINKRSVNSSTPKGKRQKIFHLEKDILLFKENINQTCSKTCAMCQKQLFPEEVSHMQTNKKVTCYCRRCIQYARKGTLAPWASQNEMDPGPIPDCLKGLNLLEKRLLAKVQPFISVVTLPGGQYGTKGQCINFSIDINEQLRSLPCTLADANVIVVPSDDKDKQSMPINFENCFQH
ncbi:uncharacterized protein [Ptychodera flava]|uniref:uncharacterized protein n=1 Tax=Ptychodera flava TaxID=63121 RepID=UPI00396A0CCA